MTDIFRVTVILPGIDHFGSNGCVAILTPSGAVDTHKIKLSSDEDQRRVSDVRSYVEDLIIRLYPSRKNMMHGSRVRFEVPTESGGTMTLIEVDCDSFTS